MKFLYAEDAISMSEAVVDILTYHKYQGYAVYDGEEALSYAELETYDGIILDIIMPKLNGLSLKTICNGKIACPSSCNASQKGSVYTRFASVW